jgi:hypothetical protein
METFRSFAGATYFFTTDLAEVPAKTLEDIDDKLEVDYTSEPFVAACGIDDWSSRGTIWVVITKKRVASRAGTISTQNLFSDVTGVERKGVNITILSPGNISSLFSPLLCPSGVLIEKLLKVIQKEWIAARSSQGKQLASPAAMADNTLDKLERFARLLEVGYINQKEFDAQKARLFAGDS